jgi:cysteine synthase B
MAAETPGKYYLPNQFDNPDNVLAHYESTGPELFAQTEGRLDVFVAGMGTGGTLMGVSRYLKEAIPAARVVGVEPPMGHRIQGLKNMQESIRPKIYDPSLLDDKMTVVDHEAFTVARRLAILEGIFVGMSSGAAVAGAIRVANRLTRGVVVVLLPDRGDRYLSTELFQPAARFTPKVA